MAVYYIDPLRGSERGDGLSPKAPKKSIKGIAVQPGDTVRFACDRVYREALQLVGGGVRIANNHFGPAPVGSAIYSIITKEAEAQIVLDNNIYESDENYLTKGVFNYELQ